MTNQKKALFITGFLGMWMLSMFIFPVMAAISLVLCTLGLTVLIFTTIYKMILEILDTWENKNSK